LDHGKPRGSQRSKSDVDIDVGHEPPLSAEGGNAEIVDRRRVSVRWFSGTILTGLCGAALMGGAVYASLDGETYFAAAPERAEASLRGSLTADRAAAPRKGDKLVPMTEASSARQVVRASTTTRVGDREVIRVRPFIRVASNLALSVSELSANIPPFNAQRLLAEADRDVAPENEAVAANAETEGEVSFVTRDLAAVLPRAKIAAAAPIDEIIARVREVANWAGAGPAPAGLTALQATVGPGTRFAYAAEGDVDPYAGFEARIVPENITLLPKTTPLTGGGNPSSERTILVKKGDSVATILRDLGATPEEIRAITAALGPRGRDNGLKEGQKLRVLLNPATNSARLEPIRVIVLDEDTPEAVVALADSGRYVAVDVQHLENTVAEAEEEEDDGNPSSVRLYQSIYETALRNQVPRPVIDDLIRIYSYDVDFQRRVQPGDSFEVFFTGEEDGAPDARGDVLYAALTISGETKKFYRFQTTDDGVIDYYDETGKSAKKFLVRKPVATGVMRSGFGSRRHPILGYSKVHTGVDWAAPNGTPIYASGNGIVEKAGWEGGYGKYVRIRHTNGYETAYGHMTAFARGIQPGTRVRQGQVIGYVGSTGLSTGAHVHYEIMVNGRFVDPMRIKLPRGRVLEGPILAKFEAERDRLENLMNRAPARMAQTAGGSGR